MVDVGVGSERGEEGWEYALRIKSELEIMLLQ